MQLGKYVHEVMVEATPDDIAYFLALRTIEAKERKKEQRRVEAKSKVHTRRRG